MTKPKQYSTNKTYEGEICTEALNRETSTGKRVWYFALKTKKELVDMQAWDNSCEGDFSRLKLGAVITATGYFKKVSTHDADLKTFLGEESTQIFILKAFYFEEQTRPQKDMRDHIIKEYGSISKWKEETRAWIKSTEEATGEIACVSDGAIVFREAGDCIGVGKHWIPKIDFCMDVLGAEFVTKAIKELTKGSFSFAFSADGNKKYKELREKLTQMAMEKLQPKAVAVKSLSETVDALNL